MITRFVEVTNGFNWGKFMIGRHTREDWAYTARIDDPDVQKMSLLRTIGTNPRAVWVFDLQTCESASFCPGGYARGDLNKHRIWVCPMFEPFLAWLYQQDLSDLSKLSELVRLSEAESAIWGHRRKGPIGVLRTRLRRFARKGKQDGSLKIAA